MSSLMFLKHIEPIATFNFNTPEGVVEVRLTKQVLVEIVPVGQDADNKESQRVACDFVMNKMFGPDTCFTIQQP